MAQQILDYTAPDADFLDEGAQKINANFTELYALSSGLFNVRSYGAQGGGWDTRVADQQAHADAFAAANAAAYGGTVYTPPGLYYLTGGFTQGKRVVWQGGGASQTTIGHYQPSTTLVTSLEDGNTGGDFPQRGWRGFRIYGDANATGGIYFGNCSFAFIENVVITGYLAGFGVKVENSINFTENMRVRGLEIYDCAVCVDFVAYPNPLHSFGGTNISNVLLDASRDNAIALRIGANSYVYGSVLQMRFVGERASSVCMDVNATATLHGSSYMLNFEGLPQSGQANGGTGLKLRTGATLTGSGIVALEGSITNDIQSGTTYTLT